MGQSTDGILFYGLVYGDELDEENLLSRYVDDFERLYATKVGIYPPKEEWSKNQKVQEAYRAYWAASREANKESKCEVGTYCSGDYPMYFVCVKAGLYRVGGREAIEIPDNLTANPEWKKLLKAYCDLMELPYKEPKWLLVSYWG